jgi:hypothetical protein
VIPPEQNGSFVANMEMVLDVYKRQFDPLYPVVCMDESPKQLIAETKVQFLHRQGRRPSMTMNTSVAESAMFSFLASHWQGSVR